MPSIKLLKGNHAAAYACKSARVGMVAAYPITPQSPVVEKISEFVEAGELPGTEFVKVESEQSAIAAVIAASATGSRVFTASSANGLAYMHELLPWAAGTRLPVVLCIASRALAAPWSVWTDHADVFATRDCGWITMFAENNQEIYDTVLTAYRVAEDPNVYLPAFCAYDGYILSHTLMPVQVEDIEKVDQFLPPLKHHINLTDFEHVKGVGPVTLPDPPDRGEYGYAPGYFEFRFSMQRSLEHSLSVIKQAHKEFSEIFGRSYGNGVYKTYKMEDAEVAIFAVMSVAAESRLAVDFLREKGIKVGLVSLKVFRPFPSEDLREIFKDISNVVVFDREIGYGWEGVLSYELKAALYKSSTQPDIKGYIVGLGGRDITYQQIAKGVQTALTMESVNENPIQTDFIGLQLDKLQFLKREGGY
ncbi:MAG: pyruvate ferredoxin oxidoreductase [Candidatus Lokiarchaeota archaeon]|nr:pyruvate ferredoxin oxidoreductase [Candidatus Lokiarchaeota archaeon]